MRLDFSYDQDFINLYNNIGSTERGKQFLELFGISRKNLDPASMGKLYFSDTKGDRSLDPNGNCGSTTKAPNHFISEIFKGLNKLNSVALLHKELKEIQTLTVANECISDLINGGIYCHDLSSSASVNMPYCWSFSTANILDGRKHGSLQSKTPKRSDSFIAVLTESVFELAGELCGAIALADFFVVLSWFYKNEGLDPDKDYKKVENDLQRMVHSLNMTFRIGNQSCFTNFSLMDRSILKETFKDFRHPDGSDIDIEYIQKLQIIFMQFMSKKDPVSKLPYRFPVVTCNIKTGDNDEIVDQEFFRNVCKYNSEGIFNIFITKKYGKLASCCRLINNTEMIKEFSRFDSFGNGGGVSIGSARVCTINLVRVARLSKKDINKFFNILYGKMNLAKLVLLSQRNLLKRRIDEGFLKFFLNGWINLRKMFSTFGIVGLWECLNEMGFDIRTKEGIEFTKQIFTFMEEKLFEFSKELNIPLNLEAIPGEGAATTLAKMDTLYFDDSEIIYPIYSNQFVPLWLDCDILERAKIDGEICKLASGGSICHLNIGTSATPTQMKDLINYAISCGLEHFALNPCYVVCENKHVTLGKSTTETCSVCGKKIVDKLTRIVGYFVPVSNWDKNRRKYDFPNRTYNYLDTLTTQQKDDAA